MAKKLFGIGGGGSKSSSQTQSTSTGAAEDWSTSSSVSTGVQGSESSGVSSSGGYNGSTSSSTGGSIGGSSSNDRIAFEDLYAQLYGGATGAADKLAGNPFLSDTAGQLFSSGLGAMGVFDKIGNGTDAAGSYLASILGGNGEVDNQIKDLGTDISRFLDTSLTGVRRSAASAGQLGGSGQSLGEGNAISDATRTYAKGVTDIRTAELQRKSQAAAQLQNGQLTAANSSVASLNPLYGLAEQGFTSSLTPFAALSSILGGPTTLGSSVSSQQSWQDAMAQAFGEDWASSLQDSSSFGNTSSESSDNSYGYNTSTSQSSGSSKGKSAEFKI